MTKSLKTAFVRLERKYSRGRVSYDAGDVIEVPAAVVGAIEAAEPRYGYQLTEQDLDDLTKPAPGDLSATDGARNLAAEAGIDLQARAGEGSGPDGRITKADVEGWQTV